MTAHRKNKVANKSTGGSTKAGLAPSIGKQRLSRDRSLTKSVVNLTNDNLMLTPPPAHPNVKFFHYHELVKPKVFTLEELLDLSIKKFVTECPNKFFAAFILISHYNKVSVFLYNKPNSPYKFLSCTFTNFDNTNEKIKTQVLPGKAIKIDFSNSLFVGTSTFLRVIVEHFIYTRMPYSQINALPIEQQKSIENSTNLLTGYKSINVLHKDIIDKHNVLCNFLPTEAAGVYEFVLDVQKMFDFPHGNRLTILTHKVVE